MRTAVDIIRHARDLLRGAANRNLAVVRLHIPEEDLKAIKVHCEAGKMLIRMAQPGRNEFMGVPFSVCRGGRKMWVETEPQ